jgi:CRP-like cAMP-binding protein
MPRPVHWYLKKVELFANMSDEEMDEIIQGITMQEYPCKHILYTPQEAVEATYILKEGEVTLYKTTPDGKQVILDILKPGAIFGNIGFDPGASEGHYAEISQKSYVCTLPPNFLVQLMKNKPEVALRALQILSKRISQYESQLKFLSMLGARERILSAIRLFNEKEDKSILPSVLRIPTKVTHEKLANMTGLTRETVTKQLQKLEQEQLIQSENKHIRLTENGVKTVLAIS